MRVTSDIHVIDLITNKSCWMMMYSKYLYL